MADWYFRNKQNSLQVCPGCRNLVRKGEEFCPFCAKRLAAEGGARGMIRKIFSRPDSMSRILLGAIIAVFLLQLVVELLLPVEYRNASRGGFFSLLTVSDVTYILMGSNFQPLVYAFHEYWRFLTYCFLHIGLLHIFFNSWALWDLGRLAERLWGARQIFASFILTGIFAGAVSYVWGIYILGSIRHSAGASGAICGLLGMLLGAYYKNRYNIGEQLGAGLIRWAVYILAFGLIANADNAAHIGGMLSGAALGYFLPPTQTTKTGERDRKVWNAIFWLSAVILVACVACVVVFAAQGSEHALMQTRDSILQLRYSSTR